MNRTGQILCKKRTEARQDMFLAKLVENNFNISATCRTFPLSRQTFYNWRKQPKFDRKYLDLVEERGDQVEEALFRSAIDEKNTIAQIFICKTLLKNRGYVEAKKAG